MLLPLHLNGLNLDSGTAVATLSGTLIGATEADIVAGGRTLIITLTNDTWVATVGDNNAITQALIDGLDSAQAEAAGWNAVVQAGLDFNDVTRDSDTQVTILLPAFASYLVTADEVITATIPATALTGASPLTATPTVTITDTGKVVKGRFKKRRRYLVEIDGQFFEVRNQAEAQSLFRQVRELAEEQVETDEPIKPITITVKTAAGKESRSSGILSEVRQTKQAVSRAITQQKARIARDRELSELLIKKIAQEEEDALIALLLL